MSRRKDRERYLRLKQRDPDYAGFRGLGVATRPSVAVPLETIVCSVCHRKRNVPASDLPEDRHSYVCLSCEESPAGLRGAMAIPAGPSE